jgi:hypothetical protein
MTGEPWVSLSLQDIRAGVSALGSVNAVTKKGDWARFEGGVLGTVTLHLTPSDAPQGIELRFVGRRDIFRKQLQVVRI